jgi:ribosomal protein S18 acetylase RimI-like enzyme
MDINSENRVWVIEKLEEWGMRLVVRKGTQVDAALLPGWVAQVEGENTALLTYQIAHGALEVVTLKSWRSGIGLGSALLEAAKQKAVETGCREVWLITTNDNLHALGFYQRRAFVLRALYPNAMEQTRKIKQYIPELGMDGIPLRDELELVWEVKQR